MADINIDQHVDELNVGLEETHVDVKVEQSVVDVEITDEQIIEVAVENLPAIDVTAAEEAVHVEVGDSQPIDVTLEGQAGPPGLNGVAEQIFAQIPAGVALGGHRVVAVVGGMMVYADHSDVSHVGKVLGVTTQAIMAGNTGNVVFGGPIQEPSWSWVEGAVYLGANGLLTQTAPTTGFLLMIGRAIDTDILMVNIQEAVIFAA